MRSLLTAVLAALLLATATTATAPEAMAATKKVVIVVGPVGGSTANYKESANRLADQARSYGASVARIYSPNATWSRVSEAAKGANVLIYLGHGNGWPSPYSPFSTRSKDGMGLNATAGNGNSNTKYFGEYYMARLGLAANAVVVLNRLCYASGNNEWGAGNPTKSTAIKRVDNYGAGFLKSQARAVFASGITGVGYVLKGLFKGDPATKFSKLFWTDPSRTGDRDFTVASSRTAGATAILDPYAPGRYYRSVVGFLGNFWLGLLIAPLGVALLGLLIEWAGIRRLYNAGHDYQLLFTFGLALILNELIIVIWGPVGISHLPPAILRGGVDLGFTFYPKYRLFVMVVAGLLVLATWLFLEKTRYGAIMRAGIENKEMVSLLGIDIHWLFTIAFALGAYLAGIAGALIAPIRGLSPGMGVDMLGIAFVVVALGGLGNLLGAIAAGLLIGVAQAVVAAYWTEASTAVIYAVMAIVLLWRPQGLFGIR